MIHARNTILLLVVCCLSATSALAHPFHDSIAEAEWNPKTKSLEVALRVNPIELEQALRRMAKRPIDLDKTKGVDRLMRQYLNESFVVTDCNGSRCKLKWVGSEISAKEGWLYFEFSVEGGIHGATIVNAVFFESLGDQANTINFRAGSLRRSFTLTSDKASCTPMPVAR